MNRRLHWLCAALLAASSSISAQSYPSKPIRIIVPFPPGGANDIATRTLNIRLPAVLVQNSTKTLESPEIKERFAGAGIETGTSTPDGLAQFMKKDFELWDKLIKSQGIKLE
jgi:tripartite-type tricarboxylate transporter receptor subunit TctC